MKNADGSDLTTKMNSAIMRLNPTSDRARKTKDFDQLSSMMAWEQGDLDEQGTIELFQNLVDTGLAWQLQGAYGRQAEALIDAGEVHLPGKGKDAARRSRDAMSKQDFVALADHIREHNASNPDKFTPEHIDRLATFCQGQNPNFNTERWTGYITGSNGPSGGRRSSGDRRMRDRRARDLAYKGFRIEATTGSPAFVATNASGEKIADENVDDLKRQIDLRDFAGDKAYDPWSRQSQPKYDKTRFMGYVGSSHGVGGGRR